MEPHEILELDDAPDSIWMALSLGDGDNMRYYVVFIGVIDIAHWIVEQMAPVDVACVKATIQSQRFAIEGDVGVIIIGVFPTVEEAIAIASLIHNAEPERWPDQIRKFIANCPDRVLPASFMSRGNADAVELVRLAAGQMAEATETFIIQHQQ